MGFRSYGKRKMLERRSKSVSILGGWIECGRSISMKEDLYNTSRYRQNWKNECWKLDMERAEVAALRTDIDEQHNHSRESMPGK